MKKIKIFFTLLGSVAFLGFQSCLDYDIPTDDFDQTEIKVDDTIYRGAADSIDYMKSISEEGLDAAIQALNTSFRQARGGIYAIQTHIFFLCVEEKKARCLDHTLINVSSL